MVFNNLVKSWKWGTNMRYSFLRKNVRLLNNKFQPRYMHTGTDKLDSFITNKRFWSKSIDFDVNFTSNEQLFKHIDGLLAKNSTEFDIKTDIPNYNHMDQGMVIIPKDNIIIPIMSGRLQVQHATKFNDNAVLPTSSDNKLKLIFCGFAPNAQSMILETNTSPRILDEERKKLLDESLILVGAGVSGEELSSREFEGTPPSRIYRSFVCPREPKKVKTTEDLFPLSRHAHRIANEIMHAVRQVKADRSKYLRNFDKSILSSSGSTGSSTITITTQTTTIAEGVLNNKELKKPPTEGSIHPVVLVLDNIRSVANVGSMFRSAETAGAAEVITTGITAHPPHPKLLKTALQSIDYVPTRHFDDIMIGIEKLKEEGYTIAVLETTNISKKHTKIKYPKKVALVLGNEITGVDTRIIDKADIIVEIPTYGIKNSLNVSSAASIVLFEVLRQWHEHDEEEEVNTVNM